MKTRLIDVREYPDFANGHIDGSEPVPLRTLGKISETWDRSMPITFVCRSGRRAEEAREILAAKGFQSVGVLQGGVEAWKSQGKSLTVATHLWSMERQVRVVAGSLVLIFVVLGAFASSTFFFGAGLIGAGLVYAGVSNTCMMASVLGRMPWNSAKAAA